MKKGLRKFKLTNYVSTERRVTSLLQMALTYNEIDYFLYIFNELSETKGMTALARKIGMSKKALIEALLDSEGPSSPVLLKLINYLGYDMEFNIIKDAEKIEQENIELENMRLAG